MRALQFVRTATATLVAIDVGSSGLRVAEHGRPVREHRFPAGPPYAVARGSVADSATFQRDLRSLVHGSRRRVQICVPSGTAPETFQRTLTAVREALGTSTVVGVPSSLAALRGVRREGPALVVDIGAQLIEVSWVDQDGNIDGTAAPWGLDDLVAELEAALVERHRIRLAPLQLGSFWAGSTVTGRSLDSGAVKVVRVDRSDIACAVHPYLQAVVTLIDQVMRPESMRERTRRDLLLVGGGAAVRDVRSYLEERTGMNLLVPFNPARVVLNGLLAA